jgi:hypothetical protein
MKYAHRTHFPNKPREERRHELQQELAVNRTPFNGYSGNLQFGVDAWRLAMNFNKNWL